MNIVYYRIHGFEYCECRTNTKLSELYIYIYWIMIKYSRLKLIIRISDFTIAHDCVCLSYMQLNNIYYITISNIYIYMYIYCFYRLTWDVMYLK